MVVVGSLAYPLCAHHYQLQAVLFDCAFLSAIYASPRLGATRAPDTGEAAEKKMAAVPNEETCQPACRGSGQKRSRGREEVVE